MTFLAAFTLGVLALAVRRKQGTLHPAFLLSAIWAVALFVFSILGPSLGLNAASSQAVLLITLGVGAFCAVPLLAPAGALQAPAVSVRVSMLVWSTIAVFVLFVVGYLVFARGIGRAAGVDFSELTLSQIRYYQTAEDRSGGGLPGLLYSLAPLSACLFLLSGRAISRVWYVGLVPLLFLVVRSPAKTAALTVVAASVLFFGLVRLRSEGRRSSARLVIGLALVVVLATVYFLVLGSLLGKDRVDPALDPPAWVPLAMVVPVLYLIGGISAVSLAMEHGLSGTQWGRSAYSVLRLLEAVGFPIKAPETIAESVPIPVPFNVFTAFGDLWFDFGAFLTVLICLILGLTAHRVYRRARYGSLPFAWLTALAGTWALSSFISFRVLYLDSVFVALVGALVLFGVQSGTPPGSVNPADNASDSLSQKLPLARLDASVRTRQGK